MTKLKKNSVQAGQMLIIYTDYEGEQFASFKPYTASDISAVVDEIYPREDVLKIFCFDPIQEWHENISEEVAKAWLENNIDRLDEYSPVPAFIAQSDAWSNQLDDWRHESATDRQFGSYEKQNRLTLHDVL